MENKRAADVRSQDCWIRAKSTANLRLMQDFSLGSSFGSCFLCLDAVFSAWKTFSLLGRRFLCSKDIFSVWKAFFLFGKRFFCCLMLFSLPERRFLCCLNAVFSTRKTFSLLFECCFLRPKDVFSAVWCCFLCFLFDFGTFPIYLDFRRVAPVAYQFTCSIPILPLFTHLFFCCLYLHTQFLCCIYSRT